MRDQPVAPGGRFVDSGLFTKTVVFAGIISSGEVRSLPLSVELSYSEVNDHKPFCIVRGTQDDADALEDFCRRSDAALYRLEGISEAEGRERIVCERVLVRNVMRRHYPADERQTIKQEIAALEVLDVTITHNLQRSGESLRHISFKLTGTNWLWLAHPVRRVGYDGNVRTELTYGGGVVRGTRGVSAKVRPHFLYASPGKRQGVSDREQQIEKQSPHREFLVEAQLYSIEMKAQDSSIESSTFRRDSVQYVDDINLIMSFLSKVRIDWFSYTYVDEATVIHHYRDVRTEPDPGIWWEDIVLTSGREIRLFLNSAMRSYRSRRTEGDDLRSIILLYVTAQRMRYVEDRFVALFRALEQIVGMAPRSARGGSLVNRDVLDGLRSAVRTELQKKRVQNRYVEIIERKLGNIGQPDLRTQLAGVVRWLRVDLRDIGEGIGVGNIFRIRNRIMHARHMGAYGDVVVETARLETLVERLILSLLGWRRQNNTPTYGNRVWMRRSGYTED